jgi:acetyl-CoA acetyltransferase
MEGMHDAYPCYFTAATGGLGRRYGLVTMCIGGGQGLAAIFERP